MNSLYLTILLRETKTTIRKPFNSLKMKDINFKTCRKAVNQAKYSCTAEKKALALKLLTELTEAVASLTEVAETRTSSSKKKKDNPLARKVRKNLNSNQRMEQRQARTNVVKTEFLEMEGGVPPSHKATRSSNDFVVREGETPTEAYYRMRNDRHNAAKAAEVAATVESFEATLEASNAPF